MDSTRDPATTSATDPAKDPTEIAEAFSRHDFSSTYSHLAPDIHWDNVGAQQISGRDAVIAVCEGSTEWLNTVTVMFLRFRTVTGDGTVVIDTLADYAEADGRVSTVASCDLYDFTGGRISRITSYTMELAAD